MSMGRQSLDTLPFDLLLELSEHLDLNDVLNLLRVCNAVYFRALSESRCFWIRLLERTRKRQMVPCPLGMDCKQLDIATLRTMACYANRIEEAWKEGDSRVNCHSLNWGTAPTCKDGDVTLGPNILAIIPGTTQVVIHASEQLVCMDVWKHKISSHCLRVPRILSHAHYDEPRCHYMALVVDSNNGDYPNDMQVFSIAYDGGDQMEIQLLYVWAVPDPDPLWWAIFIHKDVVDARKVEISCVDDVAYIAVVDLEGYFFVYRFPAEDLPYGYNSNPDWISGSAIEREYDINVIVNTLYPRELRNKFVTSQDLENRDFEDPQDVIRWSPLGLHAVLFGRNKDRPMDSNHVYAATWVLDDPYLERPLTNPTAHTDGVMRVMNVGGKKLLHTWAPSNNIVAVLLDHGQDTSAHIRVFRFIKEAPSVQSRRVQLPSGVEARQICSLAIEERSGIIYAGATSGKLFALPYY
ncbi:hypothetical protein Hypma_013466 [Hypsizygus marmoreus]|uniref:F-box domain-containing protein n=1 Tax=Hypsizygus marmoreus TaxID=39966 RepID=A0A369JBS2_HYPMA|nr:hypothetical protein Hypma_013466 [Hypsizygus marmoreus]